MMGETFHFLRPDWLWGLLALPVLFLLVQRRNRSAGGWREACDPELLPHLLHTESVRGRNWAAPAIMVGWLGAVFALAGPTWERLPEVAYHEPTQTVAVLQLTPSMHASDIAPSRLERARYELQDLLEQSEGTVGLVIFAEEAYGVTPLTDDPKVISEIVPTLDTSLMPGRGTRTDRGIAEANQLLKNAGANAGRIILLVDGAGDFPDKTRIAAAEAVNEGFTVSVLGLGSDIDALSGLADAGQGRFSPVLADDRDIASLLSTGRAGPNDFQDLRESGLEADTWKDAGLYLLWIPLLLAPLAFRRGWAGSLGFLLLFSAGSPGSAEARVEDWFSRPDQQGATAFQAGRLEEAVDHFEDREWRGVAAYRSGQHPEAIEALSAIDGPRARYNLGNALAQNGQLQEAIAAYDAVLEMDEAHADALHNRELLAKLLKEQEKQQEEQDQQESQDDSSSGENEDSQSESGDSGSPDSQSQEEQSNESQSESDESGASENQSQDAAGSDEQTDSNSAQKDQTKMGEEPSESQSTAANPEAGEQPESAGENPSQEKQPESAKDQAASELAENREPGSQPDNPTEPDESNPAEASGEDQWTASEEETPQDPSSQMAAVNQAPMSEEEQEVEQWLSRVPDDPGGLLREKIRRRYAEKQGVARQRQGGTTWQ